MVRLFLLGVVAAPGSKLEVGARDVGIAFVGCRVVPTAYSHPREDGPFGLPGKDTGSRGMRVRASMY